MDWTTLLIFSQQPEFLIGLLTGVIVAAILAILLAFLRRQPAMFEAFTNEAGKILISRQALQEQIQRCCEELGEVGKARATVIARKDIISIRVRLRIRSSAKLAGISGYLQEQISSVLHKNLGIENVGPIDIVVTGILPSSHEETSRIKPDETPAD